MHYTTVVCPYCGKEHTIAFDAAVNHSAQHTVEYCDDCERFFVAEIVFTAKATARKICGEE